MLNTKYKPCNDLVFSMRLEDRPAGRCIAFCCGSVALRREGPYQKWLGSGEKTVKAFLEKREILRQEFIGEREIDLMRQCVGCNGLMEINEAEDISNVFPFRKIQIISYGFPSVCNCKCIYCLVITSERYINVSETNAERHGDEFYEIIHYLENNDLLDSNCLFHCASGEISIHPDREKIYKMLNKRRCLWSSNAFIYSEDIAQNLRGNPLSKLHISLDSGTRETFMKIKGFDFFDKVVGNLRKYREAGKVHIKYIVFIGINDSIEDYNGIIAILKELRLTYMEIAVDNYLPNHLPEFIESIALLAYICKVNGIDTLNFFGYQH
jgi:hypothetical protein